MIEHQARPAQLRVRGARRGQPLASLFGGPGYYLRHVNYDFRLEQNNGGTFAADATFRQVAGLADSSAVSFQSYNLPDRYIRHSNYLLRLGPGQHRDRSVRRHIPHRHLTVAYAPPEPRRHLGPPDIEVPPASAGV